MLKFTAIKAIIILAVSSRVVITGGGKLSPSQIQNYKESAFAHCAPRGVDLISIMKNGDIAVQCSQERIK